jgi:hypothetical protein
VLGSCLVRRSRALTLAIPSHQGSLAYRRFLPFGVFRAEVLVGVAPRRADARAVETAAMLLIKAPMPATSVPRADIAANHRVRVGALALGGGVGTSEPVGEGDG